MVNKKRVFVASSSDLSEEREKLKTLLYDEGFEPILWEDIDHSITKGTFQERINKDHLSNSDIVIFLIKSRLGKFTKEEFDLVYTNLDNHEKMYVYFFELVATKENRDEIDKIWDLQTVLEDDGKLYIEVKDYEEFHIDIVKQMKNWKTSYKTFDCQGDRELYTEILLMINLLIAKNECSEYTHCILYQKVIDELIKIYDRELIHTAFSFLLTRDFIKKQQKRDNGLSKKDYIQIMPKAHSLVVEESELLEKLKGRL